jgi:hypothetical protein
MQKQKGLKEMINSVKDFSGCMISSSSSTCQAFNGKTVEKTIKKAFPSDPESTLWIAKLIGSKMHMAFYEDEMIKAG